MIDQAFAAVFTLAAKVPVVQMPTLELTPFMGPAFAFLAGSLGSVIVNNWLFGRDIASMKATLGIVADVVSKLDDRADRLDSRITRIEGRFDGFPKQPR